MSRLERWPGMKEAHASGSLPTWRCPAAALVAGFVLALAALPSQAAAQQREAAEDGWWEWALADLMAEERTAAGLDHRHRAIERRFERARMQWDRRHGGDVRARRGVRGGPPGQLERRARGGPPGHARGPAFCRSGHGHPVFGRSWCLEKGFGLGGHDVLWRRGLLDEIGFRLPGGRRAAPHRRGSILDEAGLVEILGEAVLRQLLSDAGRGARRGGLTGRWVALDRGGSALQLRADGLPLAELTDLRGDGRVDALLIAELLRR